MCDTSGRTYGPTLYSLCVTLVSQCYKGVTCVTLLLGCHLCHIVTRVSLVSLCYKGVTCVTLLQGCHSCHIVTRVTLVSLVTRVSLVCHICHNCVIQTHHSRPGWPAWEYTPVHCSLTDAVIWERGHEETWQSKRGGGVWVEGRTEGGAGSKTNGRDSVTNYNHYTH